MTKGSIQGTKHFNHINFRVGHENYIVVEGKGAIAISTYWGTKLISYVLNVPGKICWVFEN